MTLRTRLTIAVLALAALAHAQESRGTIVGRITDQSGAVIAGAEVRATNLATNVTATSKSNEQGNFVLPYLLPGDYTVHSSLAGFKKFVREGLQMRIGDTVELNIQMQVGDAAESVEVSSETVLLSTAEASLGQVIDSRRVVDLPSFGGSPMLLVQLAPGVVNSTDMRLAKGGSFSINKNSQFATDGGGTYNNEFTLDGVPNTQAEGGSVRVGFIPPSDAVLEFKVQTASFDASVGHTVGALVNVTTKGGGNELHGESHWWVRNRVFDTPNLFQNRSGQKPAVYQDNRYGLTVGGPVLLPKLYNGRNKTFWFYGWDANKFGVPQTFISTVPTDAMRKGDLSALLRIGSNYQVYDPATTVVAPGGRFSRTAFPDNIIPASRLDPVALKILPYWPSPNQTGTPDGRNNYFYTPAALEKTWDHLGRIDQNFSQNHRAFVRFHKDFWEENKNHTFPNTPAAGIILNRRNEGVALDDVYVFSPTFLFNFRYGLERGLFIERRISRGFDLASLGFSPQVAGSVDKSLATFPNVQVGSLTQLGNWESGDGGTTSMLHSFGGNFTKLIGNHTLRFGADFRVYRQNFGRYQLDVAPQLVFGTNYTRGPFDNSPSQPVGGELASFLVGIPGNPGGNPPGEQARTASYAQQDKYFGAYLHDDFKVTQRLTLNLGLRYEYEAPVTERFDRSVAHFAFDQSSPIEAKARANYAASPIPEIAPADFKVRGGLTYVNVGANPRTYWNPDKLDFLPRFGLAYQLTPRTTLRGGYGVFFDTVGVGKTSGIQTGFSQSTPIQASLDGGLTYRATTANPFPDGLLAPVGATAGLAANLGQSVSFYPVNRPRAYLQRWSFGAQQALPQEFLVEATYVGNRGTHLGVNHQIDNTPAQYLSQSLSRDQQTINFLSQVFPNPFNGTHPIYGSTTSRGSLLRPYPQFTGVTVEQPVGYTWYHALQTRIEKRFSHRYTFQLSYTYSKTMQATEFLNPTDPVPYRTIGDLDRTHHLVASFVWELPFGRGKRFSVLTGGWQLNGLVQRQSGPPLGFGDVWTLFTGNPDGVKLPKDKRNVDRWFNTDAGFNKNTAQQLASNIRFSPLRFSGIRADGQARWDFSAIKNFQITERVKLQYRAECLNAWNHPNLSAPNTTVTSTAFGTITGQDVPRAWQMSLKLKF